MKLLLTIGTIIGVLGITGCGKDEQEYKYQYSYNGCDTGEHKFDSVDGLCASLQSDSANRGCAESIREQSFKSQCPGTFVRRD